MEEFYILKNLVMMNKMKRLLLPLLAALALPTAVSAESYWLILRVDDEDVGVALEKIEMKSMEQCEEQGENWKYSFLGTSDKYYMCFIGK